MNPPRWSRLGGTFALGLAALAAEKSVAAEPPIVVVPAAYTVPAAPEPEIERFHGTVKVNPPAPALRPPMVEMTPPVEPPIVQIEARMVEPVAPPDTRVSDAVVDTLQTVREDTRRVSTAAAVLLGQVGSWMTAPPVPPRALEPRAVYPTIPITINNPSPTILPQQSFYPPIQPWMTTLPSAPVPMMPVSPTILQASATMPQPQLPPPQPTIIVLREPAPPASMLAPASLPPIVVQAPTPTAEPSRGLESYLGFGVGVLGLGVGLAGWLRSSRKKQSEVTHTAATMPTTPQLPPPDGVMLAGGLYAGPRPELGEPFDLGLSYADEQLAKKKQEEESQNAVLEFILNQNLALQAAFAGPTVEETRTEPTGETPVTTE